MLRIFTGDDRVRAMSEITKLLGPDHETIDGANLDPEDLPSLFLGTTLFAETRHILIRDLSENQPAFEKLPHYLDTPHDIVLLESKLDKRSATYKELKGKVEIQEFTLPEPHGHFYSFDIIRTAKRDGSKAITMLREIEPTTDPIMFFGALVSDALKGYSAHQGTKEKKILKELSALDLSLKSSPIDPWLLIESFLLRLPTIQK